MEFTLGSKVKSKVTGFVGITTSRTVYLNGCVNYCVTPGVDKDNKVLDSQWVDVQDLELVTENVVKATPAPTGGGPNSPSRSNG